jgi:hypothetical protein
MSDPASPKASQDFTPRQLAEAAEREVRFRLRAYPRFVAERRMLQAKADYEIAAMRAIAARLWAIVDYAERRDPDPASLRLRRTKDEAK